MIADELTEKCLPNNDEAVNGNCGAEQFQCKSGECIPIDNLCDGSKGILFDSILIFRTKVMLVLFAECQDASDETVEYCASKCCPPFGFRCGYGACVIYFLH